MTDYSKFRRSPDMVDWMSAQQGQYFVKQLGGERDSAFAELIAVSAKSTDPKVTKALARWQELDSLAKFLANAAKERVEE